MWQRRQTLYMAVALALLIVSFFIPAFAAFLLVVYITVSPLYVSTVTAIPGLGGEVATQQIMYVGIALLSMAVIWTAIAIFRYKDRPSQVRFLSIANFFTLCTLIACVYFFYTAASPNTELLLSSVRPGALCMVAAVVLSQMAIVLIRKDEKAVRSMDRLR